MPFEVVILGLGFASLVKELDVFVVALGGVGDRLLDGTVSVGVPSGQLFVVEGAHLLLN